MSKSPVNIPGNSGPLRPSQTTLIVPPTPGPRSLETIQNDARDRFAGVVWIQREPSRVLEDYFSEYDFWEVYSENKSYSKRPYQAAYKGIMRDYNNYLCILNGPETEDYYVVAKRIRNELETLESYCSCTTCVSSMFNPLKYMWCPHCTRCIKAGPGFADQEYINKARTLKKEYEDRKRIPSKYGKYIQGMRWIKLTEIVVVLLLVIGLYLII